MDHKAGKGRAVPARWVFLKTVPPGWKARRRVEAMAAGMNRAPGAGGVPGSSWVDLEEMGQEVLSSDVSVIAWARLKGEKMGVQ